MHFVIEPSGVFWRHFVKSIPSLLPSKVTPSLTHRLPLFELTDRGLNQVRCSPVALDDRPHVGGSTGFLLSITPKIRNAVLIAIFASLKAAYQTPIHRRLRKKLFAAKTLLQVSCRGYWRIRRISWGAKIDDPQCGDYNGQPCYGHSRERMALSLQLVPDNDKILFTLVATSPFTGNNAGLIDESRTKSTF